MKRIYIIYPLLLLFFMACNDSYQRIDWELEDSETRLVVEGDLTSELKFQQIKLTESNDYFSNTVPQEITDAKVYVTTDDEHYAYSYSVNDGVYLSDEPFAGEVGKTYTLNIELNDPINNETYFTSISEMNRGIEIDSISAVLFENILQFSTQDDSLMLFVTSYGWEPKGEGDFYEFVFFINDTALSDTVVDRSVIHDLTGGIENLYAIPALLFEQVEVGDKITLEIHSVSEAYEAYISGIKQIAQGTDPLGMSGPPANAVGNIVGGEAMGFFQARYITSSYCYTRLSNQFNYNAISFSE